MLPQDDESQGIELLPQNAAAKNAMAELPLDEYNVDAARDKINQIFGISLSSNPPSEVTPEPLVKQPEPMPTPEPAEALEPIIENQPDALQRAEKVYATVLGMSGMIISLVNRQTV